MHGPSVGKTIRDYMLIKVPLPKPKPEGVVFGPVRKTGRLTRAEKRLWKIIQEGEREYREGKTISARSTDEALKMHARRKRR